MCLYVSLCYHTTYFNLICTETVGTQCAHEHRHVVKLIEPALVLFPPSISILAHSEINSSYLWKVFKEIQYIISIYSFLDQKVLGSTIKSLMVNSAMHCTITNPWRMREGYSSQSVCVCVCLSVTTLAATYLVFTSKIRCLRVLHVVFQICNVWLLLRMLCFKSYGLFCSPP